MTLFQKFVEINLYELFFIFYVLKLYKNIRDASEKLNVAPVQTESDSEKIDSFLEKISADVEQLGSDSLKRTIDNDLVSFSAGVNDFIKAVDPTHAEPDFDSLGYSCESTNSDINALEEIAGEFDKIIGVNVIRTVDINGTVLARLANLSENFNATEFMENLSVKKHGAIKNAFEVLKVITLPVNAR